MIQAEHCSPSAPTGANGTGKSALMLHIAKQHNPRARRIAAHRQTWIDGTALDITSSMRARTEKEIQKENNSYQSRYRDLYAAMHAGMIFFDLIDQENARARSIKDLVESKNIDLAIEAAEEAGPITAINELLRHANIPISINIQKGGQLFATRNDGQSYGIAELSDGERNALLIAGNVLTAPFNSLLIMDEPERHLHRSIISPLLSQLYAERPDCGFVVATHDQDLPSAVHEPRILLIRSCSFSDHVAQAWDMDELPSDREIDDAIKLDLLGARRKILFVEGTERSLDKLLYSIIFPAVSVVSKGSCHDVERAVAGSQAGEGFHWLQVFGVVDGDGFSQDQAQEKRDKGIFVLPYYSVEAIYYHPEIVGKLAANQARSLGRKAVDLMDTALEAAINEVGSHTNRLSRSIAMKAARKSIIEQIPSGDELLSGTQIQLENEGKQLLCKRKAELDIAVSERDWDAILSKCSVRETRALDAIAKGLRYQQRRDYEDAVRQLLSDDEEALTIVRKMFGDLFEQLQD